MSKRIAQPAFTVRVKKTNVDMKEKKENIKEEDIRHFFQTDASFSEKLAETLKTVEELQGDMPGIEKFLVNVAVKMKFLQLVLSKHVILSTEEVVGFMKCSYGGIPPPPFDNPENLTTFVWEMQPVFKLWKFKYLTANSAYYQILIQCIAYKLKNDMPVNDGNIDTIIRELVEKFGETESKEDFSRNIRSNFKDLEALAEDIPWFCYDVGNKSLSLTNNHADFLASWLTLLIPQFLRSDYEKSGSDTTELKKSSAEEKGEEEEGNGSAITEEFKERKITQRLRAIFFGRREIPLSQIARLYFDELKKEERDYECFLEHRKNANWSFKAFKIITKRFEAVVDKPQEFLENDEEVVQFIQNHPNHYDIDETTQTVTHFGNDRSLVAHHIHRYLCKQARTVKMNEITTELHRQFPRFPTYLLDLEKLGQMEHYYDSIKFMHKEVKENEICYTLCEEYAE